MTTRTNGASGHAAHADRQRVLVTGHDGYIGSVMVRTLTEAGHDVAGLDTYYFEDCVFGELGHSVPASRKDTRDIEDSDLQGFDAVVDLAALSNDPLGDIDPELTYAINLEATVRLAGAAKRAGVKRFLYSSSCSVYGAAGDEFVTEDMPVNPLTPYAISKVRVEEELLKLSDQSFSPVFLRNATAYGVSPRLRMDLVLNNLVGWAVTTGKVRILSDGTPWRPIVHVEDIARAFAAVLSAPREAVHNQVFNVGVDRENYQVKDLAEIVRDVVPNCEVEIAGNGTRDERDYRVCFKKLPRRVPDFKPKWTAYSGAKDLFEAFQRVGLEVDEVRGGCKYTRLRRLRYLMESGALDSDFRWVRNR